MRAACLRLGVPVEAIDDDLLTKINSAAVQPNTLVTGIPISAITKGLMSSLRIAHERGAQAPLMTANTSEWLAWEFDERLHIASDTMMDAGLSIQPPVFVA